MFYRIFKNKLFLLLALVSVGFVFSSTGVQAEAVTSFQGGCCAVFNDREVVEECRLLKPGAVGEGHDDVGDEIESNVCNPTRVIEVCNITTLEVDDEVGWAGTFASVDADGNRYMEYEVCEEETLPQYLVDCNIDKECEALMFANGGDYGAYITTDPNFNLNSEEVTSVESVEMFGVKIPLEGKSIVDQIEDIEPEVLVGETVSFEVYAKHLNANPNAPLELFCQNCNDVAGLQMIRQSNDAIQVVFDSGKYMQTGVIRGLPQEIPLHFHAVADTSNVPMNKLPSRGYRKLPITVNPVDCTQLGSYQDCDANNYCFWVQANDKCLSTLDASRCGVLSKSECTHPKMKACVWSDERESCISNVTQAVEDYIKEEYYKPEGYEGPIPDCAFSGTCRKVNDLLELFLNYGNMLFSIIAAFAFAFFVYGGFTFIISFGNPERVKKGQQIMVAAVVGLIIVFSAYVLVSFLLDALHVKDEFRGL